MTTSTQTLPTTSSISIRVGGTYKNANGDIVTITSCDIENRDYGFYYADTMGLGYRMDGTNNHEYLNLVEVVDLSGVDSPVMEVGKSYITERCDYVDITRMTDEIEGYPYRSSLGDLYSEQGERYLATPGSHLVRQEDRPLRRLRA